MAIRNGKANSVDSKKGAYSPRSILFRNAGLASVWDWGDDAESSEPTGTPIACDIDCVIGVTSEALALVDSEITINGSCAADFDTRIMTTGAIGVYLDQRLFIYEVTAFARDFDLQAVTLNERNALFDERIGVSNTLLKGIDFKTEITGLLVESFDLSFCSYAFRTIYGDVLISIPNPELFRADISVAVSRTMSTDGDQRIAVSGFIERLADCLESIWGAVERWSDIRIIAGEKTSLDTDQAWRIDNISVSGCDIAAIIANLTAFDSDIEIRITTRLAPDADTHQRVFIVLIKETHLIQV